MIDILFDLPGHESGYIYTITPEVVRGEKKVQPLKEARPAAKPEPVERLEKKEKKESA